MKHIKRIFFLTLILISLCTVSALAGDYYTLDYYTDPTSIPSVGGDVTLTVTINHDMNSAYVMKDAAIYKDDRIVIDIGDIYAGQEVTKSGWLSVDSDEILGVNLKLRYSESDVTQMSEKFVVTFNTIDNIQPEIEFERTLSKTSGDSSEAVTATYTVKNVGQVHIEDLVITDEAFGEVKTLSILKTGQNTVEEKEVAIGEGFISIPTLNYNVGSQAYSTTLESMEVTSGTPELSIELMSNKSTAAVNEVVEIAIKVENSGTTGLKTVTINEENLGELFVIDGLAEDESVTKTYELFVEEGIDYKFVAVGDNGGELEWLASEMLDVIIDIEAPPLPITFSAIANTTVLDAPGIVNFELHINNESTDTYTDVIITDNMGNEVDTITRLMPGPTKFQYKMNIDETNSYYFVLKLTNMNGKEQTLSTAPTTITISTPAEEGDDEEVVIDNQNNNNESTGLFGDMRNVLMIGLAIAAALLIIVIAQVIVRNRRGY